VSNESGDSDELEALFDSIVQGNFEQPAAVADSTQQQEATPRQAEPAEGEGGLHARLGHLTRTLHDTLRELGYDQALEQAVGKIPDARQRLDYISELTEQAAVKTLNAVEEAKPMQHKLESGAAALSERWQALFERQLDVPQFKELVLQTRDYLREVPASTQATSAQLMDIVMAQDYQDLTGQVLKRLAETVQQLENQLIGLLIESLPEDKRKAMDSGLLNGPVISAEGRSDIVTSQEQVDDLLESLGF